MVGGGSMVGRRAGYACVMCSAVAQVVNPIPGRRISVKRGMQW